MSSKGTKNGRAVPLKEVPAMARNEFRQWVVDSITHQKMRLVSLFASDTVEGTIELFGVLADDTKGTLLLGRSALDNSGCLESMASIVPQAQLFEREIAEQYGIIPAGHPWLKPVRFHGSYRDGKEGRGASPVDLPGVTNFFQVSGEEVHEVAVGPVHAGVIEPGHFRFQCQGEQVFHLEIALGYQHRGIERALIGGPHLRTIHHMETVAGDTTIGHALAYCQAIEALSRTTVTARAQSLRGVLLELERLANHVGDLGALANDVAYQPTASYCGRLRGDFLNMTEEICGSRYGRGMIRPGGIGFDLQPQQVTWLKERLRAAYQEVKEAVDLLWDTPGVVERFESTGCVSTEDAESIGMVGPAARACGLMRDVRHDHPDGIYRFAHIPVMTAHQGDVNSRAFVRWREIQQSVQFILHQLDALPQTNVRNEALPPEPESVAVSLVEGWRGEICHVAITNSSRRFVRYKITDPSFHNWFGLALALRGGQISDFPLCNKSFNLSYCGHDL